MPHKYKKNVCAEQYVHMHTDTDTPSPSHTQTQAHTRVHVHNNLHYIEDKGSFCIATLGDGDGYGDGYGMSYCRKFISKFIPSSPSDCFYNAFSGMCAQGEGEDDGYDMGALAKELWDGFVQTGAIHDIRNLPKYTDTCIYASAVCSKHTLPPAHAHTQSSAPSPIHSFKFALAWDHPIARFGTGEGMPRFYTK